MHFRASILTLALAFTLGVVAAWSFVPRSSTLPWREHIVAKDPELRQRAWQWLLASETPGMPPRAASLLEAIDDVLSDATEPALFDASTQLRGAGLWGWDHQSEKLVFREMKLRSTGDAADKQLAVEQMASAPLDLDERAVFEVVTNALDGADERLTKRVMETAFGWYGPDRRNWLVRMPVLEDEQTRKLVRLAVYWARGIDARQPVGRSWARFDADAALQALSSSVVDADGHVYASVLLAEHSLAHGDAAELARQWIVDFNDDRKRAGALLAAMLGEHADLLAEAFEVATDSRVRTAQRLALQALGQPVGSEDPIEFAYRSLFTPDGDVNPDALLCLLAAGYEDAPRYLARRPESPRGESIRPRTLLVERFIPHWHVQTAVETDVDDNIRSFFDALRVVWMLTHRRLQFQADDRTYRFLDEPPAGTPTQ